MGALRIAAGLVYMIGKLLTLAFEAKPRQLPRGIY